MFEFELRASDGRARAGIFRVPHGDILTPVFMPVGTQAAVKGVTPRELGEMAANVVLSNTYHLYLRPGDALVARRGGLHRFMGWPGPMLTDSGGFQVFSLSAMRKIDEQGVTFKSHLDGSLHRFTPEKSISIQENLGADIIMAFDECPPPTDREYVTESLARTHAWARRCRDAHTRADQALFGIVQGGIFQDLRARSAQAIMEIGFPGYAIGGLAVGETKTEMYPVLAWMDDLLPRDKPRYLMGVGDPRDLLEGIARGVDLFDCVLPTRLARHAAAFTHDGRITVTNQRFAEDDGPLDAECDCATCQHFSRAYLRHLLQAGELLGMMLMSVHNLRFLIRLVADARAAIFERRFEAFASAWLARYAAGGRRA